MTYPSPAAKGTKTQRLAEARLRRLTYDSRFETDAFLDVARRQVPDAWHTLEADVDCFEPKEKISLYLERSVVRMFKSMGVGYQQRINRILATWLQMKIADKLRLDSEMARALSEAKGRDPQEARASDRRPQSVEEHWAYIQGQMDALIAVEEPPKLAGVARKPVAKGKSGGSVVGG